MRKIFWGSMMLIYMLEDSPAFGDRVRSLFIESSYRGDELMTSWLVLGELMAGACRGGNVDKAAKLRESLMNLPLRKIPFDERCTEYFSQLRAGKVAVADSIHLACAAAARADLFLTNDKALHKLHVPGIKFIAGLDSGLI